MNESFMIGLPCSVEAFEYFDLNIDIELIKWKEDKMPRVRFFSYAPQVKIAEVVATPENYQVVTRYRKKVHLHIYNTLEAPILCYDKK